MGIFDIFKKNESVKNTDSGLGSASENEQLTPENEEMKAVYAESLAKTERIATLLEISKGDRDESWVQRFLTDLPEASFRSGNPQVIAGLDGFPYFQLVLPEPGTEFQSFVIDKMKDDFLLERGFGVVINPGTEQPDWVLTYGDILNFQLNGSFFTKESTFSQNMDSEIVKEKEEVLIGQPSETILPAATRKLLKDFFELNGIADPKVLLMMRKQGEQTTQDLAFNITPDQFETEEHFRNMMQTVTWYLPRHYSIIGLKDDALDSGFMSL